MELTLIDSIAFGAWITLLIINFGIFIVLFIKRLKLKEKTKIQIAFCFFFLCLGIGRAILVYPDYFLGGMNPSAWDSMQTLWKIANLFEIAGLGFLIAVSEYAVFKGKDYFVFIGGYILLVSIGIFFMPVFKMVQTFTGAAVAFAAFIPISYIYLAIKFPLVRRNVILLLVGFLIFGASLLLISIGLIEVLGIDTHLIYLFSAIGQIPGILLMAIAINRMYFVEKV